MHAVVTDRLLSPIRPFVRRVSRTVGTFVRLFVMTVDETMTYFSGFHSQRGPRLFHSRFLAAPRPTVPRPWPREDPRTDARALYLASGAISPRSSSSFIRGFPPSFTVARYLSSLSLSFHVSLNRSTALLPFHFFEVIRSRRSDRSFRDFPSWNYARKKGKYVDTRVFLLDRNTFDRRSPSFIYEREREIIL